MISEWSAANIDFLLWSWNNKHYNELKTTVTLWPTFFTYFGGGSVQTLISLIIQPFMGIEIPWRSKLVCLYKPLNVTGYNNKKITVQGGRLLGKLGWGRIINVSVICDLDKNFSQFNSNLKGLLFIKGSKRKKYV